ncbi:MAG: DUF4278 domain-containing protein [Cyanobacteria bacterium P01_F01_bin.143]
MNLFFLIPLATGIGASYVAKRSSDEIGYLMGSLTFFSFILSLVIAPWEVKMVVFAIAIASSYKFWRQTDENGELEPEDSQLSKVESDQQNTSLEQEKLMGTYRGKPYYIKVSQQQAQPQRKGNLKYRGVSVNNNQTEPSQNTDSK